MLSLYSQYVCVYIYMIGMIIHRNILSVAYVLQLLEMLSNYPVLTVIAISGFTDASNTA